MSSILRFRVRQNFGGTQAFFEAPNLIDAQRLSYERFLQKDVPPLSREDFGLEALFNVFFPLVNASKLAKCQYLSYSFG
jgi:DNA-directed RNA polymerase subunit beta